jgi:hypothetical protein
VEGGGVAGLQPPKVKLKKKTDLCRHNDIRILRDLAFSLDQPLKSADWYIGTLPNAKKKVDFCKFNFPCNLTRCRLKVLNFGLQLSEVGIMDAETCSSDIRLRFNVSETSYRFAASFCFDHTSSFFLVLPARQTILS